LALFLRYSKNELQQLAKKETLDQSLLQSIQKAQFFYPSLEKWYEELKDKIIATLRATSRRNSLFHFTYCLTINPAVPSVSCTFPATFYFFT
jgi:hypothetical protein